MIRMMRREFLKHLSLLALKFWGSGLVPSYWCDPNSTDEPTSRNWRVGGEGRGQEAKNLCGEPAGKMPLALGSGAALLG